MQHSVQASMETLAQELEETSRKHDGYLEAAADYVGLDSMTGKEASVETMGGPGLHRTSAENGLSELESAGARLKYGQQNPQKYEIDLFEFADDTEGAECRYRVEIRRIDRQRDDELLNGNGDTLGLDAGDNKQDTEWEGLESPTYTGTVHGRDIEGVAEDVYDHIRQDNQS